MRQSVDGVLLVALGGPASMDEVRPFIREVLGGRRVPSARIEEVVGHYEALGGRSPLPELTRQQADALQQQLADDGHPIPVFVGMRCSAPWLRDTVQQMAAQGVRRAAVVIMAAHRDDYTWGQYGRSLAVAGRAVGDAAPALHHVADWHDHPSYIAALAERITEVTNGVAGVDRASTPLLFSAHSLPQKLPRIDEYVGRIRETARLVATALGWADWSIAYQSRTGRPEDPWLEPDVGNAIADLADRRRGSVVVAPIGFVCDHVEVLYDLDIQAAAIAAHRGLRFLRAGTVGTHPVFVKMLSELVRAINPAA
jgi:ferrochelatase